MNVGQYKDNNCFQFHIQRRRLMDMTSIVENVIALQCNFLHEKEQSIKKPNSLPVP